MSERDMAAADRIAELQNEVKQLNEGNKHFREAMDEESPYCPTCDSCGISGCCSPDKCKDLKENLKCLYGIDYAQDYKELLDENESLQSDKRELVSVLEYAVRFVKDADMDYIEAHILKHKEAV
jgi:hypothetical protein